MANKVRTCLKFLLCLSVLIILTAGCGSAGQESSKEKSETTGNGQKIGGEDEPNPEEDAEIPVPAEEDGTAEEEQGGSDVFRLDTRVIYMKPGDRLDLVEGILGDGWQDKKPGGGLSWTSSQPEVAGFESDGSLYASNQGNAVISCSKDDREEKICVNVYDGFGSGSWWDMDVMTSPDVTRTFRNYAQSAYEYGDYSDYIAMHGCALCCTTTVVRAWDPEGDWTPEKVCADLEPQADPEGYEKNYAKSLPKQMPLTLKGISRILACKDIPHQYVTEFDKNDLIEDLTENLRRGYMIVYEAGRGGYHMMMVLGVLTDGSFIISDSVGADRVKTVSGETLADQMFSCKKEPQSSYFAGRKTAGGYIVVGKEE